MSPLVHQKVVESLFNTVTGKRIAIFGFAFKKDTGDTRESAAIYIAKYLLEEHANVAIFDPKVTHDQILTDLTSPDVHGQGAQDGTHVKKMTSVSKTAYEAATNADAVIIATEWDEFKSLDYQKIYDAMNKPAFIFDGRLILDSKKLSQIGFHVKVIGKTVL